IGDAYYTNILPDDQHYSLIYRLFPPRMRVVNFITPSLYVQVPARSFGKFLGSETAQLQMASTWEMGRSAVMAHMSSANVSNDRAMRIFLDGFRNGLRVHFGGTTTVSVTPFSGFIPKTDVQYKD